VFDHTSALQQGTWFTPVSSSSVGLILAAVADPDEGVDRDVIHLVK
jgi:(2Fe-2S) ferredoxin